MLALFIPTLHALLCSSYFGARLHGRGCARSNHAAVTAAVFWRLISSQDVRLCRAYVVRDRATLMVSRKDRRGWVQARNVRSPHAELPN